MLDLLNKKVYNFVNELEMPIIVLTDDKIPTNKYYLNAKLGDPKNNHVDRQIFKELLNEIKDIKNLHINLDDILKNAQVLNL